MLRLLYATGARVSEIASLTWGDVVEMPDGRAIINLYASKTDKSYGVTISADLLHRKQALSQTRSPDTPLLLSRQGNPLSDRRIREIVAAIAERAGVELPVSPTGSGIPTLPMPEIGEQTWPSSAKPSAMPPSIPP